MEELEKFVLCSATAVGATCITVALALLLYNAWGTFVWFLALAMLFIDGKVMFDSFGITSEMLGKR